LVDNRKVITKNLIP